MCFRLRGRRHRRRSTPESFPPATVESVLRTPAGLRFRGSPSSWEQAGLPTHDAVQWWASSDLSVSEGADWWRAGYSPAQAEYVTTLVRYADADGLENVSSSNAWRDSGLPAHVVCLCLAARIHSVTDAHDVHRALVLDPDHYRILTDKAAAAGRNPWRQSLIRSMPAGWTS